jgi:hypothetical protein
MGTAQKLHQLLSSMPTAQRYGVLAKISGLLGTFGDDGCRGSAHISAGLARWMTSAWSGHQEEVSGEEIKPCSAKHLAFEQLQAVDLAFDRALTPGLRDGGLDGGQVRPEPSGETPEGRQGALGGAGQPWIEVGRLALADEGGEVLRERHGLCQRGGLRGQLCQLVAILRRRPLRRAEDQPGGPARREQTSRPLHHCRQRLRAAPLPGGQPLGLAHASDIQGHNPILAPKALATDHTEEMRAIATPTIPPGQEGHFVGIKEATVAAMSRLALRKRRALEGPRFPRI